MHGACFCSKGQAEVAEGAHFANSKFDLQSPRCTITSSIAILPRGPFPVDTTKATWCVKKVKLFNDKMKLRSLLSLSTDQQHNNVNNTTSLNS